MLIGNSNNVTGQRLDESRALSAAEASAAPSLHELERKLAAAWPADEWRNVHAVLAVSGGADSVALLRAALAIKSKAGGSGKVYVGHLNHGLRGPEADADQAWLNDLCRHLDVPFETVRVDVSSLAAEQGDGIEAAARDARYTFLRQTAERLGARFVVTAHTADDQVETVLQRIVRGTGLAGLAGIPRNRPLSKSVSVVRPMLTLWRREITEYLDAIGQSYRTDASNDDPRHTRNRLRHELLPFIRDRFNANVDSALVQLAVQAEEAQHVVEAIASDVMNACVAIEYAVEPDRRIATRVEIDCSRLANEPPAVVRELCKAAWTAANWPLQSMGFAEWQRLAGMAAESCQQAIANLPANIRVRREGSRLYLTPLGLA